MLLQQQSLFVVIHFSDMNERFQQLYEYTFTFIVIQQQKINALHTNFYYTPKNLLFFIEQKNDSFVLVHMHRNRHSSMHVYALYQSMLL